MVKDTAVPGDVKDGRLDMGVVVPVTTGDIDANVGDLTTALHIVESIILTVE